MRTATVALSGVLAIAGLSVVTAPQSGAESLPGQCSVSGLDVTCTYHRTGGDKTLDVPSGVGSVHLRVVGQAGITAEGSDSGAAGGGRGALVVGEVPLAHDGQDLLVQFRDDGGASAWGGAGGDSTRVQLVNPRGLPTTAAWAAGGGGGGYGLCGSAACMPGGGGGHAGKRGFNGGDLEDAYAGAGGEPGTSAAGGAGGTGGTSPDASAESGTAGTAGAGGSGVLGGGGGGGLFGGGGGGGGATYWFFGQELLDPSGGGGGGSSLAPPGGSVSLAAYTETARVVVSFSLPSASVSPAALSFPDTNVGRQSVVELVTLTNSSGATESVTVSEVSLGGASPSEFVTGLDSCSGAVLDGGDSCSLVVGFRPTSTGEKSATLTLTTNASNSPHVVSLSGTATQPELELSRTSVDFADTLLDHPNPGETITVTNTGDGPLAVAGSVSVAGANSHDFVRTSDSCSTSPPLEPGEDCMVVVQFRPRSSGAKSAVLRFNTDAPGSPHEVGLAGIGVATAAMHIRGPGSAYAEGHGNRQTLTIGTSDAARATFYVKIFNKLPVAQTYKVAAESLGANADATLTLTNNAVDLPKDAEGRWITPSVAAGGSKILAFRVDPTARLRQVTANHLLTLHTTGGAQQDHATFETNIQAGTSGTDGFGLYAKAYGGFVGGDVDGQTATHVPFGTGQTKSYTVKLRNDGAFARSILATMDGRSNDCWSITVKRGTQDITTAIGDGGYTTPLMRPGTYLNLAVSVKRVAAGCGAAEWEFATWDDGEKVHHSTILANAIAGTE